MLTKREACLAVIGEFCVDNKIGPEDLIADKHIFSSSKLAVAMEYLGLIEDRTLQEYAATRGGAVLYYFADEDVKILTFRELLDLLPEDKKKGKIKWTNIK